MDTETILAIITALGVREIGGQLIIAWRGRRTDERDDFDSVTARLQTYVTGLEKRVGDLETKLDSTEGKLRISESRVQALEAFVQAIASALEMKCPYSGERCLLHAVVHNSVLQPARVEAGRE